MKIIASLLLLFILSVSSQLIRLPLEKSQVQSNPGSHLLNLYSQPGALPLENDNQFIYYSPIKLGSQNQNFKLALDTGSPYLWVANVSLKESFKNSFNCSMSRTCTPFEPEIALNLPYKKGSFKSSRFKDTVNLGGLSIPEFMALLAFESKDITLDKFDGIMGLSLSTKDQKHSTLLDKMHEKGLIKSKTFSIYPGAAQNGTEIATGEVIFGGYDPKYAASEFKFVQVKPAEETMFWETNLTTLEYGKNLTTQNISAIFDTGLSYIGLPKNIFTDILNHGKSLGVKYHYCSITYNYFCDCSASKVLPDLTLYFNNVAFNISATNYLILQKEGDCAIGLFAPEEKEGESPKVILGDVFLKNYYSLFSASNNTIGFAKAAQVQPIKPEDKPWYKGPIGWLFFIFIIVGVIGKVIKEKGKKDKENQKEYQNLENEQGVHLN